MNQPTKSKRILALDILRGITIAGMIMVNNPGSWTSIYAPLKHAEWEGLTPTDLIFPFFMFIMGISTYISLRKYRFEYSYTTLRKIIKRTFVIFFIGLALGWFTKFCYYWVSPTPDIGFVGQLWESVWTVDRIRILGILQRLALCYGATAIIALTLKQKYIPYLIAILLAGYTVILFTGNGFAYNSTNILSVVDRAVLTPMHMYRDNGIDPEGVLSTIPSIAHVLLGFCVGGMMMNTPSRDKRLKDLFILGTLLTFTGFLLAYGCPLIKKAWTPTFVLATCGLASSFLALLIWTIDEKNYRRWSGFFHVFGVNPLFLYTISSVLAILLGSIQVPYGEEMTGLTHYIYISWLQPVFGDLFGSLIYAWAFVAVIWLIGYPLFRKKIYIKI
ncbi:MAG: heparan-alpha-glucosaminide N-acetyltransferase domain-containing protein [Prevotellaceae bacterium]|jgi:predicted acyltransferase|nr:heparan-alpha-glucosaminide N-acetyltransferase domain-containing protein [Prevotellaceae bacterium]